MINNGSNNLCSVIDSYSLEVLTYPIYTPRVGLILSIHWDSLFGLLALGIHLPNIRELLRVCTK